MKSKLFILATLLLVIIASVSANRTSRRSKPYQAFKPQNSTNANSDPSQRISVWPQPQSVNYQGSKKLAVIPNWKAFFFKIATAHEKERVLLSTATSRYLPITFFDGSVPSDGAADLCNTANCLTQAEIYINSTSDDVSLHWDMNEWYEINVSDKSTVVTIKAMSIWGAIRALETFSQLIGISAIDNRKFYQITALETTQSFTITDFPRFKWRGLLIDTSRHYFSVNKIKQIIDGLSFGKFNVLHWHIVDAQSFPLQVPAFPLLSEKGAYTRRAVYTPDQVHEIVAYAYSRGVRVVAEFDVPGHAASWGAGYPQVVANCPSYIHNINNIPLNPAHEQTFEVLKGVVDFASSLFIDNFMHFGADELVMGCWKEDKNITKFMQQKGFTSYDQLLAFFESNLRSIYTSLHKTAVMWEEILLEHDQNIMKIPKDTVIQAWRSRDSLAKIVKAGFSGLLSAGWYLDKQKPGAQHYLFVDTWQDFYSNDPLDINVSEAQKKLVLGGEAAMWSEQVDDVNFDSRVYPRVLAISERLWSASTVKDLDIITFNRLEQMRCRLVKRGIHSGPIMPGFCDAVYEF